MKTDLYHSAEDPLYRQIEETLQEMIEETEYEPGDRIPSERALADQLGVSRMSVRRAVENLIGSGLLERRSTSGTYVCSPQVVRPAGPMYVFSLSRFLREEGKTPGSQILELDQIRVPRKVASRLQIRVGAHVWVIRRLRLANDQPFCIETSFLPAALVPDLDTQALREGASLYELLEQQFALTASTGQDEWRIAYATSEEAGLLKLSPGDPILLMRSVIYDQNGHPIEYLKSVNHPEKVVFRSNLSTREFI
ncbi:MAG: GntR family transcriptional regulator [Anaerolineales bacterium]|nr:GntR family transcriptional regulator [Anaerolineales bacterium]